MRGMAWRVNCMTRTSMVSPLANACVPGAYWFHGIQLPL